jgi:hypothetical protein
MYLLYVKTMKLVAAVLVLALLESTHACIYEYGSRDEAAVSS